jgi:hypothetical protein
MAKTLREVDEPEVTGHTRLDSEFDNDDDVEEDDDDVARPTESDSRNRIGETMNRLESAAETKFKAELKAAQVKHVFKE